MNASKQKKLREAGWSIGTASDFLELSDAEAAIVEMKLALASNLRDLRRTRKMTQQELANRLGSSQSRVAKMEVADDSVSIELIIKSLVSLGATPKQIGKAIASPKTHQKTSATKMRKLETHPD